MIDFFVRRLQETNENIGEKKYGQQENIKRTTKQSIKRSNDTDQVSFKSIREVLAVQIPNRCK